MYPPEPPPITTYCCYWGRRQDRRQPGIKTDVRANRAFLVRVVRYLADECGVRQFLDIGTGLPVAGNTHQVPSRER